MSALAQAIEDARPRVIAALAVQWRDLDLAEDAFAEAALRCLRQDQAPLNIGAWLLTVARRIAVDAARRGEAEARAAQEASVTTPMAQILTLPEPIPDERLRLIFICCHPALDIEARTALALKVICGLPVAEIARVFLVSEAAMFQRITRAKRKVRDAGIAFELPPRALWRERLDAVLLTLELAYTLAYQDAAGERDGELASEVARLARMVAELLPDESEALGLAALIWLARSREAARLDGEGAMVPLSKQDTQAWDYAAIDQARRWLDAAALKGSTGPYQVMAAIQLTHARRGFDGVTDWAAIVRAYDALAAMRPNAMVALSRAIAISRAENAEAGLAALSALDAASLTNARPYHAARGDLLARCGEIDEARAALRRALALAPLRAERLYLERRLAQLG